MTEQLPLAEAAVAEAVAPSAWLSVRAARPGVRLVREINLDLEKQKFTEIPETALNFLDGSTVMRPSIPGGRSAAQFDAIVAEYDRRWHTEGRGLRA